jgi:hypothetical protein
MSSNASSGAPCVRGRSEDARPAFRLPDRSAVATRRACRTRHEASVSCPRRTRPRRTTREWVSPTRADTRNRRAKQVRPELQLGLLRLVPRGRELPASEDARLSNEQRASRPRRVPAVARIRPYGQRGRRRRGARRLLDSSKSSSLDLRSCSSSVAGASDTFVVASGWKKRRWDAQPIRDSPDAGAP